jgi:hypothetical protein
MDPTTPPATDTPRMSALKQLSTQIPIANQQVANQQNAARQMQVQAAVKAAPVGGNTTQAAQDTGAAITQQAGQQLNQNTEAAQSASTKVANIGLQNQQQQGQQQVADAQAGAKDSQAAGVQKLAQISEQAKQEMYDSRRQFAQDQFGQKFTNERQLADYATLQAKSQEDLKNYAQQTQQLYERKSQMLQVAHDKLTNQLEFQDKQINQLRDQGARKGITEAQAANSQKILQAQIAQRNQLVQAQADLQRKIEKEKADAANRNSLFSNVLGIAGGIVGGIYGGPIGAAAGYSVGRGVGSFAASETDNGS